MIDIETLGTGPRAAVASIGVVHFDKEKGKLIDTFYRRILLESSMKCGVADGDTLRFWLKQPEEARLELAHNEHGGAVTMEQALSDLHKWFPKSHCNVWANGPAFDLVIIEYAFARVKIPTPWLFWHHRCFRTIKTIGEKLGVAYKKDEEGTFHNALDDAKRQAKYVCKVAKKLNAK